MSDRIVPSATSSNAPAFTPSFSTWNGGSGGEKKQSGLSGLFPAPDSKKSVWADASIASQFPRLKQLLAPEHSKRLDLSTSLDDMEPLPPLELKGGPGRRDAGVRTSGSKMGPLPEMRASNEQASENRAPSSEQPSDAEVAHVMNQAMPTSRRSSTGSVTDEMFQLKFQKPVPSERSQSANRNEEVDYAKNIRIKELERQLKEKEYKLQSMEDLVQRLVSGTGTLHKQEAEDSKHEVERLTQKLRSSSQEVLKKTSEVSDLAQKLMVVKKALDARNDEFAELEKAHDESVRNNADLLKRSQRAETKVSQLTAQVGAAEASLLDAREDSKRVRAECEESDHKIAQLTHENTDLAARLTACEDQYQELKGLHRASERRVEAFTMDALEAERERESLKSELQALSSSLQAATEQLDARTSEVKHVEFERRQIGSQLEQKEMESRDHKLGIEKLSAAIREQTRDFNELTEELGKAKGEVEVMKQEVLHKNQELIAAGAEKEKQAARIESLSTQVESTLSKIDELTHRLRSTEGDVHARETKIVQLKEALDEVQGRMSAKLAEFSELQMSFDGVNITLTEVEKTRDQLREEMGNASRKLEENADLIATQAAEIQQLKEDFSKSQTALSEWRSQCEEASNQSQTHNAQLQETRKQLSTVKAELDTANTTIVELREKEAKLATTTATLSQTEQNLVERNNRIADLEHLLEASQYKLSQTQQQLTSCEGQVKDLFAQQREAHERHEQELHSLHENVLTTVRMMQGQDEQQRKKVASDMSNIISQKEKELNDMQEALKAQENAKTELHKQIEKTRERSNSALSIISAKEKQLNRALSLLDKSVWKNFETPPPPTTYSFGAGVALDQSFDADAIQKSIHEVDEELLNLERRLDSTFQKQAGEQETLQQLRSELEAKHTQLTDATNHVSDLENRLLQMEVKCEDLTSQVKQWKDTSQTLQTHVHDYALQQQKSAGETSKIEAEHKRAIASIEQERDTLSGSLKSTTNQLAALETKHKNAEQRETKFLSLVEKRLEKVKYIDPTDYSAALLQAKSDRLRHIQTSLEQTQGEVQAQQAKHGAIAPRFKAASVSLSYLTTQDQQLRQMLKEKEAALKELLDTPQPAAFAVEARQREVQSLQQQLQEFQPEYTQGKKEHDQLAAEMKEVDAGLGALLDTQASLQKEVSLLMRDINDLQAAASSHAPLPATVTSTKEEASFAQREMAAIVALSAVCILLYRTHERLTTSRKECNIANARIVGLEENVVGLKDELEKRVKEIGDQNVAFKVQKIQELEESLAASVRECQHLTNAQNVTATVIEELRAELQTQVAANNEHAIALKNQVAETKQKDVLAQQAAAEVASLKEAIALKEKAIAQADEHARSLSQQIELLRSKEGDLDNAVREQARNLVTLQEQNDEWREENSKLSERLAAAERAQEESISSLQTSETANADAQQRVTLLENELAEATQSGQAAEARVGELCDRLQEREEQLKEVSANLQDQENAYNALTDMQATQERVLTATMEKVAQMTADLNSSRELLDTTSCALRSMVVGIEQQARMCAGVAPNDDKPENIALDTSGLSPTQETEKALEFLTFHVSSAFERLDNAHRLVVSQLEEQLQSESGNMANTSEEMRRTLAKLEEAKQEIARLEQEVADKGYQIEELKHTLHTTCKELEDSKAELETKHKRFTELEAELTAARGEVQSEKAKSQQLSSTFQAQSNVYTHEIKEQSLTIQQLQGKIERGNLSQSEFRDQIEEYTAKIEKLNSALKLRTDELATADDNIAELRKRLASSVGQNDTLTTTVKDLKREVQEHNARADDYEARISSLKATVNSRSDTTETLEHSLASLNESLRQAAEENKQARARADQLSKELADKSEKITTLEESMRSVQVNLNIRAGEITDIQRRSDAAVSEKNAALREIEAMQEKLEHARAEVTVLADKIVKSETEAAELRQQIKDYAREKEKWTKDKSTFEQNIAAKDQEVAEAQKAALIAKDEAEQTTITLNKQLAERDTTIDTLKTEHGQFFFQKTREVKELNAKIVELEEQRTQTVSRFMGELEQAQQSHASEVSELKANFEATVAALNEEIERLTAKNKEDKTALNEAHAAEMKVLLATISSEKAGLSGSFQAALETATQSHKDELASLREQLTQEKKEAIEELKQRYAEEKDDMIANTEKNIKDMKATHAVMLQEAQTARESEILRLREESDAQIQDLQRIIAKTNTDNRDLLTRFKTDYERLTEDLSNSAAANDQLKEQLDAKEKTLKVMDTNIDMMKKQLKTITDDFKALKKSETTVKETLNITKGNLLTKESDLRKSQEETKALQATNEMLKGVIESLETRNNTEASDKEEVQGLLMEALTNLWTQQEQRHRDLLHRVDGACESTNRRTQKLMVSVRQLGVNLARKQTKMAMQQTSFKQLQDRVAEQEAMLESASIAASSAAAAATVAAMGDASNAPSESQLQAALRAMTMHKERAEAQVHKLNVDMREAMQLLSAAEHDNERLANANESLEAEFTLYKQKMAEQGVAVPGSLGPEEAEAVREEARNAMQKYDSLNQQLSEKTREAQSLWEIKQELEEHLRKSQAEIYTLKETQRAIAQANADEIASLNQALANAGKPAPPSIPPTAKPKKTSSTPSLTAAKKGKPTPSNKLQRTLNEVQAEETENKIREEYEDRIKGFEQQFHQFNQEKVSLQRDLVAKTEEVIETQRHLQDLLAWVQQHRQTCTVGD